MDPQNSMLTSWNSTSCPCDGGWRGIACNNDTKRITKIELPGWDFTNNQMLSGTLPEALFALAELEYLDLNSNSLSGAVPASISGLAKLQYLDLSSSAYTGTLPASLTALPSLKSL